MLAPSLHFLVERQLHPKIRARSVTGTELGKETDFGAAAEAVPPSQPWSGCSRAGVTVMGRWEEAFILLNNYLLVTMGFGLLSYQSAAFQQH